MLHSHLTDIGFPAPFAHPFDEGLLAALATRPGALRMRIPDEDRPKPAPTPAPVKPRPVAPKPVTPPAKPTPAKATPVKSTDQGKAGVSNNRPAKTPPTPPAPKPKIVERKKTPPAAPKPTPKPEPKPEPTRAKPGASKPTPTERRPIKGGGPAPTKTSAPTPTPNKAAIRAADAKYFAAHPTKTTAPTPSTPDKSAIRAADARYFAAHPTKTSAPNPSTPDKAAIRAADAKYLAAHPTPTRTKPGATTPSKTAPPASPTPDKAAIRRAEEAYAKKDDATELDKLTPAERQQLLTDQAALEEQERQARERNKPTPPPARTPGQPPVNRAITEEINTSNATRRSQANTEIQEARETYFETHDQYVDANGTVYAASVDASGNIQLRRESTVPAANGTPELQVERTATIATDRSRDDVAITRNKPTGAPNEVRQTRTESNHTNSDGSAGNSQIRIEQVQDKPDGSTHRSKTEENYGPNGKATTRLQEQEIELASGDRTLDRTTTTFGANGTTPTQLVNLHETESGTTQATSSRETTTQLAADGTTPKNVVVVEAGTDGDGKEQPRTTANTDYDASGEPTNTYISRDGGELPANTPRTEYLVWKADGTGTVDRRVTGGAGMSEYEYEQFVATGVKPDGRDVPEEPKEPNYEDFMGYAGGAYGENTSGQTYEEAMEAYESAHSRWETDKTEVETYNRDNSLEEVDPTSIPGGEDPVKWTRGGDDRWTSENLDVNLVPPLQGSQSTPSVFEVPAEVRTRAAATAIDQSAPAKDPAAYTRLDQEQAAYERQLDGATTDAQREQIMSGYFADHPYYIDRGTGPDAQPVLMASAWSPGAPYNSNLFGASRAMDPHATMARTGIQGQDDMGQPATVDVVRNQYVDGTQDDVVRTSYDGPAGASRVTVTGEHTNAAGVVTERDRNAQSQVTRTSEGLPPLAVTETSRERFNEVSGKPQGEQYFAVAKSDHLMTSVEERKDYYGTDGIIFDTKIDATSMSRNYDAGITEDFLSANQRAIDAARDDDFSPNSDEYEVVTVPAAGSNYVHSTTDIDYDPAGVAIYQKVDEESVAVVDAGDDNHNGVRVTETDTTRESGTRGGTTAIFDANGALAVDEHIATTIKSTEFDPDAGTAGGNKSTGHQFREISTISMTQTRGADGTIKDETSTPLTTQTLREGFDDDWVFDEKQLATNAKGEIQFEGEGDEKHPKEIGDGIHHEDLDFADKFEEFMEGWGGRIVGIAAIVAGVAGAVFTGGASLALTAVGVGLASASFAYTALNYSQGEASGWDLALSGAGVVLAGLPAITGVKQLVNAGRAATAARAAGATDDVVRGVAQNALRTGPGFSRATTNVVRTGNMADNAMDANDAVDATRAALQGDFWGAGMMLLAVGGGAGAVRVRSHFGNAPAPGSPGSQNPGYDPNNPSNPTNPATGANGGGPGLPDSTAPGGTADPLRPGGTNPTGTNPGTNPDPLRPGGTNPGSTNPGSTNPGTTTSTGNGTTTGAPTVRRTTDSGSPDTTTRIPTSGTNTGANAAPTGIANQGVDSSTSVAGARGDGVPETPATTTPDLSPATNTVDGAGLITPTRSTLPSSPTPTVFSPDVVADPRATGTTPNALWGSDANYQRHVESHVGNYAADRMAAAGLEVPTTAAGNPIVDAASYHERALDYREMAITGRLEDGVSSYPRANGGTMLVNSRTNEVAFINPDGTIGSLYPTYAVRTAADGTYRRNGNQENRLNNFVQKELASDAHVYAIRTANASGDQAGLTQALEALRQMNPNRYDAISRELGITSDGSTAVPAGIFGRRNTVVGPSMPVAPVHLDRPLPSNSIPTSANRISASAIARNPQAIVGLQFNIGDTIPWHVDSVAPDGTAVISTNRQRPLELDALVQHNPDLVAELGGIDAIRANRSLLEGREVVTTRSNGAVEGGFRYYSNTNSLIRFERTTASLTDIEMRTGGLDIAGAIARGQGPDLLAGRNRLQTAVESFPELLYGRPLRLLRGAHAQNNGQVVSPISDGWYAANPGRNQAGDATVDLQRNVRFEDLDAAGQAAARAQGYGPAMVVLQSQHGIPVAEIVDFNRSRIEGRSNSAIPDITYRYGSLPGMAIEPGTLAGDVDPATITDPAMAARAQHLQANVEAIYDYMYSRVGWVPEQSMANFALSHGRIPDGNGGWTQASGPAHYPGSGFVIGDAGPSDAAFDIGVLAHEIQHQYLTHQLGFEGGYRTQSGSFHEGFANYAAASMLRDPVVGRVFGLGVTHGNRTYDIDQGLEMMGGHLITNRGDYYAQEGQLNANPALAQAQRGVEPHTGSGVVSTPLAQISNAIGWPEAQRLAYDAVSNPALSGQMDFGRFADALRLTALDRYPVNSPEFQAIETALNRAGITGWPAQGQTMSRITSNGSIEHGSTFLHFQQDGRAVIRQADGTLRAVNQFGFLNDASLAQAFQAQRRTPYSGQRGMDQTVIAPLPAPLPNYGPAPAGPWGNTPQYNAAPAAGPWGAPNGTPAGIAARSDVPVGSTTGPSLGRRVADHMLLSPQATAATAGAVSAQQVLDRRKRQEEQEQAQVMAELERLGFIQGGIAAG